MSFRSGLAKVRYELPTSVGVHWKSGKRIIIDEQQKSRHPTYPYKETYVGMVPDGMVVGENGKFWMQEKMVGETAYLELQGEKTTATR
jgi:hypothetical protein